MQVRVLLERLTTEAVLKRHFPLCSYDAGSIYIDHNLKSDKAGHEEKLVCFCVINSMARITDS